MEAVSFFAPIGIQTFIVKYIRTVSCSIFFRFQRHWPVCETRERAHALCIEKSRGGGGGRRQQARKLTIWSNYLNFEAPSSFSIRLYVLAFAVMNCAGEEIRRPGTCRRRHGIYPYIFFIGNSIQLCPINVRF
jgi:hypothetical protein